MLHAFLDLIKPRKTPTGIYATTRKRNQLPLLHFLHIGKTGGTALKFVLENAPSDCFQIKLHRHPVRLSDIPAGEKAFFFVREPISRFVSGFYSRKRKGSPRYASEWSPAETAAFQRFETPNHLATALSSTDPEEKEAAREAMQGIGHVNTSYWDWFQSEAYFQSRLGDVFFIGCQNCLPADFETLKRKLRLPEAARLPDDDLNSHRNPQGLDKRLEPVALENLREWYARDFVFFDFCRGNAAAINARF